MRELHKNDDPAEFTPQEIDRMIDYLDVRAKKLVPPYPEGDHNPRNTSYINAIMAAHLLLLRQELVYYRETDKSLNLPIFFTMHNYLRDEDHRMLAGWRSFGIDLAEKWYVRASTNVLASDTYYTQIEPKLKVIRNTVEWKKFAKYGDLLLKNYDAYPLPQRHAIDQVPGLHEVIDALMALHAVEYQKQEQTWEQLSPVLAKRLDHETAKALAYGIGEDPQFREHHRNVSQHPRIRKGPSASEIY